MTREFIDEFHEAHERRYGYSTPDKPVEIVNVRTSFFGRSEKPKFRPAPKVRGTAKPIEVVVVWMNGRRMKTPIYDRDALRHGHVVRGPAIIGEYSSTTLVPPDFLCKLDAYLNLVLERV
jgi:N-methylhydantoinase A